MKNAVIVLLIYLMGYQGYAQKDDLMIRVFYPQISDTMEWSEDQIIEIFEKEDSVLFCKLDLFLERNDTTFYVKNMEIPLLKNRVFGAAYLESSVFYTKEGQEHARCVYMILDDRFGSRLELTEDALQCLPKLSRYLDEKIQTTEEAECRVGYVPLD